MFEAQERVGMALDEFLQAFNRQPFELINGERKVVMPGVAGPNYLMRLLFKLLDGYAEAQGLGEAFFEMTFILPGSYSAQWVEGSRIPDLMFVSAERLAAYRAATPDWRDLPYALVPDFVVEIVSPNDLYSEIDKKVDAYLADGVRLIWVIDPQRHKATAHTLGHDQPLHLKGDALLSGGDVLPGFAINLSALFT